MLSDMDGNKLSETLKKITLESGATRIEKKSCKPTENNLQGGQNVLYPTALVPNASASECDSVNSGVARRIPSFLKRKRKRKLKGGKRPREETFDGFLSDDEEDYEHRRPSSKSANCTTPSFSLHSGISDGLESPFDSGNDDVFSFSCPVNLDVLNYHHFCNKYQRNEVQRRARRHNIPPRRRCFSEAELVHFSYVDYQMQAYKEEQYQKPRRAQSDCVRFKYLRDTASGASISESRCHSTEMMSQITSGIHSGFSFAPYVDSPSAFLQYKHRRKLTPEPFYPALPSSGSRLFPTLDAGRPPRDVEGPSALRNARNQHFPPNVAADDDIDYDYQEPNIRSGNVFYRDAPTDFEKMRWECEDQQARRPSRMGISRRTLERKRSSSAPEVLYSPRDDTCRQQRKYSVGCATNYFEMGIPTNLIQHFPPNVAADDTDYDYQEPHLRSGDVFYRDAPTDFEKMRWEYEDQQARRPSRMGISRRTLERKRSSSAPEVLYSPRDDTYRQQRVGCAANDFEMGIPTNLIHPLTKASLLYLHQGLGNNTSPNRTTQRRASVIFPLTKEYLTIHDDIMNSIEQDKVYSDWNSNYAQSPQDLGQLRADHAKYFEDSTREDVLHPADTAFAASERPAIVISPPQPVFTSKPFNEDQGRYNRSDGGRNDEICIEMEASYPHSDAPTIPELTASGRQSKGKQRQRLQRQQHVHVKLARCIAVLVLVTIVITCVIIWTSR